jgi:uncharacterized membrane protein affecting hemolysin expression
MPSSKDGKDNAYNTIIQKNDFRSIHLDYYSKKGSLLKIVEKIVIYNVPSPYGRFIFDMIFFNNWQRVKIILYLSLLLSILWYIFYMKKIFFVVLLLFLLVLHKILQKQLYLSIL